MKTAYELSNEVTSVALSRFAKGYADKVIKSEGQKARQKAAQALIDYLCDKFRICKCPVRVTERPRAQRMTKRGKVTIYGFYKFMPAVNLPLYINMYNTTPSTHKEVAGKAFLETLVHEFCHHYDYQYLGLSKSAHTAGFYRRVSDLYGKLV